MCHVGYAATDGREFWLTPKVLGLGQTYLGADRLVRTVQPSLDALSRRLGESTTFGAGWAILSTFDRAALEGWLTEHPLKRYTPQTVTGVRAFRAAIRRAAVQGFVLLENQYEIGLRGIAVPLRSSAGEVVGALSVSSTIASASTAAARARCVPALRATADALRSRL